MTIEKCEQLSSFVDGELDSEDTKQFLDQLCNDKDLKQSWERYHVISDSIRSRLPDALHTRFSESVMSAIESEPTILAPTPEPVTSSTQSTPQNVQTSVFKRVSGFAIAASVATIAVIGVQSQNQVTDTPQLAEMPVDSEFVRLGEKSPKVAAVASGTPGNIEPLIVKPNAGFSNASTTSSVPQKPYHSVNPVIQFDPKLHKYLLDHSRNVSGAGVHEIISSARIVTSSQQSLDHNQNIGKAQAQQ